MMSGKEKEKEGERRRLCRSGSTITSPEQQSSGWRGGSLGRGLEVERDGGRALGASRKERGSRSLEESGRKERVKKEKGCEQ